jgi:hypothetical protein
MLMKIHSLVCTRHRCDDSAYREPVRRGVSNVELGAGNKYLPNLASLNTFVAPPCEAYTAQMPQIPYLRMK